MKVTFVYRFLTLGGVEVVLRSRAVGLEALGIQTTLWFLSDGPGRSLFDGTPADIRIGGPDALRRHLDADAVDLLSVIDTPEALECLPAAPCRPHVVIEVHTPYPENRTYLRSKDCALADAVFVPSTHQKQVVRRELPFATRISVVPNPIGFAFETPLVELSAPGVGPVVAWVGRLDWLKNWRGFLRVARSVMHRRPDAEFWVVGSGTRDSESEFVEVSRSAGLLPRLRWLRGLPHAVIPRLHDIVRSSGGVVLSTSRGESFGMAIAEAMARGCAVVAPRLGPFPESILDGEAGLLYSAGRHDDAADQILRLLADPETRHRLGTMAREGILRSRSTELALSVLAEAVRRILHGG
jgi:glycosyltransferase involved in cell wall biosynthesis